MIYAFFKYIDSINSLTNSGSDLAYDLFCLSMQEKQIGGTRTLSTDMHFIIVFRLSIWGVVVAFLINFSAFSEELHCILSHNPLTPPVFSYA